MSLIYDKQIKKIKKKREKKDRRNYNNYNNYNKIGLTVRVCIPLLFASTFVGL